MYRLLTVTNPAPTHDFTTLAAVKLDLGILDTSQDAILASMITAASRWTSHYCRDEFCAETVQETFRPYPFVDSASLNNLPDFIWLRRRHNIQFLPWAGGVVPSWVQNYQAPTVTEWEGNPIVGIQFYRDGYPLFEHVDFECDHRWGRIVWLWNDMPLRWHFRKLVINYRAGFEVGAAPEDIQRAVIETVKLLWFMRSRDPSLSKISTPGASEIEFQAQGVVMRPSDWPSAKIQALLAPWTGPVL